MTIPNFNAGIHPASASINILLSDSWSSLIDDVQYGKWLVVHETNHAFLSFVIGNIQRQNHDFGQAIVGEFVTNPGDVSVFPTRYAALNYDTGTEYLVESMTGMLWDRACEASPNTSPHIYDTSPISSIVNQHGIDLDTHIRQLIPYFLSQ